MLIRQAGWLLCVSCICLFSMTLQAAPADIRTIPMHNPKQPFELAAKLQWNPHHKRWDKVLVLYNGAQEPANNHPIWDYLNTMQIPQRQPKQAGENLYYKAFKANAYCNGSTPLASGKPLYISFEKSQVGAYQEKDFLRDWNCPQWGMGLNNAQIITGKEARTPQGKALRIQLLKGRSGCNNKHHCANWKPQLGTGLQSLYYSYWLKLPENFNFVRGGKLPGIGSQNANTGGKKPNGRDGWSIRAMWNQQGHLGQYVYHMDQPKPFGEFLQWDAPPLQKGRWHHIKTFVRLNAAGKNNGQITTWLNGNKVLDKRDLRFRLGNDLAIERLLFAIFYGGTGPSWAPPHDMHLYVDDFTLSSTPH